MIGRRSGAFGGGNEMRARDKFKYGSIGAGTLVVASAILLTTGWGQVAAATVTQVFVTNKGPTQAVPVHEQGTANVNVSNGILRVSTLPPGSTPWYIHSNGIALFTPPAGKTTLALTSVTASNNGTSNETIYLGVYTNSNCTGFANSPFVEELNVLVGDTIAQAFPQPLILSPGGSWCLGANDSNGGGGHQITAVGYYY